MTGLTLNSDDLAALQQVFGYAASTVGERTLQGKVLRWKPGRIAEIKAMLNVAKASVDAQFGNLQRTKPAWVSQHDQSLPNPAGPATTWQSSNTSPAPRQPRMQTGLQRDRSAQRSSSSETPPATPAPKISLFTDVPAAALKGGGGTLTMDATLGLQEGAMQGANLYFDLTGTQVQARTPAGLEADPLMQEGVNLLGEMLNKSGLLNEAFNAGAVEVAQSVACCLPAIGAAMSLTKGVAHTVKTGLNGYKFYRAKRLMPAVTAGIPRVALQEVQKLLALMVAEQATRAGVNLAAGSVQTAGLFADMGAATGPATGLAKAIVELTITIMRITFEFTELRRGNKILLAGGPFDRTLLTKSPILACYVLTNCESSTLYAFLTASSSLDAKWMDEVESQMPKIEEVRRLANYVQRSSPFVLPGFESAAEPHRAPLSLGDHFLDFRAHKSHARFMWEAKMVAMRDPQGLHFLKSRVSTKASTVKNFFANIRRGS